MKIARSIIVTAFEDVVLSDRADTAIGKVPGKFHDKRTKRGKLVERLSDAVAELSELSFLLELDDVTELFEKKNTHKSPIKSNNCLQSVHHG